MLKKIYGFFFCEDYPIRRILFNIITIVGLIGGTFSLTVSIITGLPAAQNIIVAVCLMVLCMCLYLANFKGKLRIASIIIIIWISMFLMPMMFFTGGGVYSGMPSWFIIGIFFTFLLIEGRLCWFLTAIQVLLYLACIIVSYLHPELVNAFPTRKGEFVDITQSMIVAAFSIGLIIRFQTYTYEKVLKKSIEQNKQLEETKDIANKANSAKTKFLSNMSHDIRTPINGIIGMLEIAENNPDDTEKQADCRRKIKISSDHLLSLINDVLDISMIESGKIEFTNETFDIIKLVEDCTSITRNAANERNIKICTKYENMVYPYLCGSPLHVRQIIINIAGNAVKYNRNNGSVIVNVKECGCENEKVFVSFTIEDTGIGMSEEFLSRIYEPFTQAHDSARTKYEGTGLGMAITKGIVEQMKGTIGVKSSLNEGTVFKVTIPFRIGAKTDIKPETDISGKISVNELNVLLVEDNDLNREIAQYMLEREGVHVVNAVNGQEAVEIFSKSDINKFDCILMDVMMPVMDGLEATKKIRALERADALTIPIIAMTANAYADDVKKAKNAGMNEHISKPIDKNRLFTIIMRYCSKNG